MRLSAKRPPALRAGPNSLFQVLDFHWCSPESSGVWCKSRRFLKRRFEQAQAALRAEKEKQDAALREASPSPQSGIKQPF